MVFFMTWTLVLLMVGNASVSVSGYLAGSWHCVGLLDRVDWSKPYANRVGELPLVFWKGPAKKVRSTLNICPHLGSQLDGGRVTPWGCIKCPYHGLELDGGGGDADANGAGFGQTCEHEGKLFWSYEPTKPRPPSTPFFHNREFQTSFLEIDMPCSLPDSAYNTLDLHHPQFVHNRFLLGFGNDVPPKRIRHWTYPRQPDLVGMSFDYKTLNPVLTTAHANYTRNFHAFRFPSNTWSMVSFDKEPGAPPQHLVIAVDFLPLAERKTRWYVTVAHNYPVMWHTRSLMDFMASNILKQDKEQMTRQAPESELKRLAMFQMTLGNEESIWKLKELFQKKYKYPSAEEAALLYKASLCDL